MDLARIELERQQINNSNDKDAQKKLKWLKDQEDMIQFKHFMKDKDKESKMKEHEMYMKGCDDENQRRFNNQNRWNQYYRDFDNKLTLKMNDYDKKYIAPLKEKEIKEN